MNTHQSDVVSTDITAASLATSLGLQVERLEERTEMASALVCCVIVVL